MTGNTRPCLCRRWPVLATFALIAILVHVTAQSQVRVPLEFRSGQEYRGLANQIAFDRSGIGWLATQQSLYRLQSGRLQIVDDATGSGTLLALAPGGGLYGWLVYEKVPQGLFTVKLMEIPRQPLAELRLPDYPHGFSALYLGGTGQLIVTATPIDGAEIIDGGFQYVFWDRRGQIVRAIKRRGRQKVVVDPGGNAILLLGESDAVAYDKAGQPLWRLEGNFRMAALAANGTIAFLNPAQKEAVSTVHVYHNGIVSRITMTSPVHDLALAADGSDGAVAIDQGGLVFVAPRSCIRTQCQLRPVPPLPIAGTFFISETRFVDPTTVAVATFQRSATGPPYTYPLGAIFVITSGGQSVFDFPVTLEQPSPGRPFIDASQGVRSFGVRTPHRSMFVELGP